MKKLKFFLISKWKKLIKIEVEYSLIVASGKEIYSIEEEVVPKKLYLKECGETHFSSFNMSNIIERDENFKKIFDDRARQLLNDFMKKERKKIDFGWLDSGNYIVKCVWDIRAKTKSATYEEYKQAKELK